MHDTATQITANRPTLFERVLVFAGSFDPPALHHQEIVRVLSELRKKMMTVQPDVPVKIVVWPVGPYSSKQQIAPNYDREVMTTAAFNSYNVCFDFRDLRRPGGFTSTFQMQNLCFEPRTDLQADFAVTLHMPGVLREIWHVIGADNVDEIRNWNEGHEIWNKFRFLVMSRGDYVPKTLPPKAVVLNVSIDGNCSDIRMLIAQGKPWEHLVCPDVAHHIKVARLYNFNPEQHEVAA